MTVMEKASTVGGAAVVSGGGLCVPCNPVSKAAGIKDIKYAALQYFEEAVGDVDTASPLARRHAYLDNGPRIVEFLQSFGFQFHFSEGYPDYYPNMDGSSTVETEVFDARRLERWQSLLPPPTSLPPIYSHDAATMTQMTTSTEAYLYTMKRVAPLIRRMLEGRS